MAIIKTMKMGQHGREIILYHEVTKLVKPMAIFIFIMIIIIVCHLIYTPFSIDLLFLMEVFSLVTSPYLFWHFYKIWNFKVIINKGDQSMVFDFKIFKKKFNLNSINGFLIKKKILIENKKDHVFSYKLYYLSVDKEKFIMDVLNVRNTKSGEHTSDKEVESKLKEIKDQFAKLILDETDLKIDIS